MDRRRMFRWLTMLAASAMVMSAPQQRASELRAREPRASELRVGHRSETMLLAAIAGMREGQCPNNLMTHEFAEACRHDSARMADQLRTLGPVIGVRFRSAWPAPNANVEEYDVQFATGAMGWQIGLAEDGRILVLWPTSTSGSTQSSPSCTTCMTLPCANSQHDVFLKWPCGTPEGVPRRRRPASGP